MLRHGECRQDLMPGGSEPDADSDSEPYSTDESDADSDNEPRSLIMHAGSV